MLSFGTGVLLSYVTGDISMSACFHTPGFVRQVRSDTMLPTVSELYFFFFCRGEFAFCYTWTGFGQVLENGVGGTIWIIGRQRDELPCSFGTL